MRIAALTAGQNTFTVSIPVVFKHFCSLNTHIISLQLRTPKAVGLQFKLFTIYKLYLYK
jgi:hypothetical protein